jgi:lipopolysaccharide/colanic/teichoic acid biosynthesis glycosyltransferase
MLPLWVLIAVAIKLSSRGPVLYKVERIGGRPFMAYKFRTMRVDAENSTGAIWSAKHDPRVMAIGRFLRHYGFDELPQLINVLKGDMNIVGPRAERPTIFAELREKIPNYEIRQGVRPGITGYAQVHLKYESSIEDVAERLKYDLEYVRHQSVLADLHIMAKAVQMIFHERSGSAVSRDVADEAAAMRQLYERERAF